jgi:hypothetical protein
MNDTHTTHPQDLKARIAGIISMMLAILRAHGWRALIHLPTLWLVTREIRRIGERFAELFAALEAGTLHLPPPAPPPASSVAPQQLQAARAQSAAPPRPAAARRRRPRTEPARAKPAHAGSTRALASRRIPPTALPEPLGFVRATARQKNPLVAASPWRVLIVTI